MSCAACDDCPREAWHIHLTVKTINHQPDLQDQKIRELGMKPVRVTNHFWGDSAPSYEEFIPTIHYEGPYEHALVTLMEAYHRLRQARMIIIRAKIEGDPRALPTRQPLYFEAHLKNLAPEAVVRARHLRVPRSTNAKGEHIYTVRHPAQGQVYSLAQSLTNGRIPRIEATVLDSFPDLDKNWMTQ